jgi:hypothetical protein
MAKRVKTDDEAVIAGSPYRIEKYGRYRAVLDGAGELVCLTVYKRGAAEVVLRLER